MKPVLIADTISKIYETKAGQTCALDSVSLTVEVGEYVGIMGPSGSGKSTFMNILGLLDTPTSGQMIFDGYDVSNITEESIAGFRAKKIGFVFQNFNLLPRISVIENVMLPLAYLRTPRKERRIRAAEVLKSVGLDETLFARKSNELSGGQMQRVAIARALVNNPSLILADEPTGNLDSKTGDMVLETFQKLHEQGKTIVLITHETEVAQRTDRVVHIRDGKIYDGMYNERGNEVSRGIL